MARQPQTTSARLARIEKAIELLVSAQAPAKSAPAQAQAKQPTEFLSFIHERASQKVACDIHAGTVCNRRFMPTSRGRENHVAKLES